MRRTAFTLPRRLQSDFLRHVATLSGYGPKGKSRWMREALAQLFEHDPLLSQVGLGEDRTEKDATELVYLDDASQALVEKAYRILRRHDPAWEGVQGDLLRAALIHRLTREKAEFRPPKPGG